MKQNRIFNSIKVASFCGMMVLTATSCSDDFFDVKNPNEISSSTFWKTESDALMALTGCYDAMQNGDLNNDYIDGWKFGFLTRETCTDNGGHSWGNGMLGSSIAQEHQQLTISVSLSIGMRTMSLSSAATHCSRMLMKSV